MEWQKQLNDFIIIGELENANPPIIAKGALLMDKQKNGELSRICLLYTSPSPRD